VLQSWVVVLVALAYLTVLFLVAHLGDSKGARLMHGRWRPVIYALTLGVYCTSWTFLGSVGLAARSGLDFLTIYLGPIFVLIVGTFLLARIVRLAKTQNITSIADFIAARYGKNQGVAAAVTIICVVGVLPYVALQLKAISASIEVFLAFSAGGPAAGTVPLLGDMSLLVALILALFATAFGTRQIDATEHQDGLMIAIAAESLIKLVAFIAVGIFVTWGLFNGPGDLIGQAAARPDIVQVFSTPPDMAVWLTMTALSTAAIVLLPRQFHVMVVENRHTDDLRRAAWMFPAYLVAINVFVIPIAVAGLILMPGAGVDRDMTVIMLPLREQAWSIALLALIGGLSAATAMVIVESVALAIMISNDIFVPLFLRRRIASKGAQAVTSDMAGLILFVRRVAIFGILLLGYAYYRASGDAALASIGLLAFAAIAQIGPAFIGGLMWSRATARGAMAGLITGLAAWAYTLFLPSLAASGLPAEILAEGPFGIAALRPTALFGLELPTLIHGVFVSLLLNVAAFVAFSLSRQPSAIERLQASSFVTTEQAGMAQSFRIWRAAVTVDELEKTVARYLGAERTRQAFEGFAAEKGIDLSQRPEADAHALRFAEHLLASAIGAASSRLVLSLMLKRTNVSTKAALKLLDDASAAIQYSRDVLQHALDHAGQAVTVFDRNLRLIAWNHAFRDIFDLPRDLIRVGVGLDEIISFNARRGAYGQGDTGQMIAGRLESFIRETEPVRLKLHSRGIVLDVRSNHLPDGGIVTTYTDITATVTAEEALESANELLERRVRLRTEELTEVNAELQRAKAVADEANLSKTRFLAAASHDILQPLNAARLYTSSLVERSVDGPAAELARNVDTSLDAVEEILTALLDISRLDAGAMRAEPQTLAIDELFRQLQIEFDPAARARGLELTFVRSGLAVRSDRRLLRRLLQNLISNAIKYTQKGKVLVGCRRRQGKLRIEVRDTGIGIPLAKQKLIFREFQRLDDGARVARGLGLGLSIVERIARVLDHKVIVQSRPGRGSAFLVELPVAEAPRQMQVSATVPATRQSPLNGLRVICIDNEPAILDGMQTLLANWGCEVTGAASGRAALALVKRGGCAPDVVVADYHLDKGDGLAAIAALRRRVGPGLRAILLTADRGPEVRDAAQAADVPVLNKPLKPAALRAMLAQWRARDIAAE
jgi:Na+/proline symporter/signal transduction histidine kinase